MEIDSYQQCPCQSGKKIKFCCGKDLVGDLNQVLAKQNAGQAIAALEYLDRTIRKVGPRDCLLTIQTHILIGHGDIEKARDSNDLFMQQNPKHVTGLHHRALIEMAEGKVDAAVATLQDAMDAITGNEIPLSLANAFRIVGVGLLSAGHLLGGRSHLQFAQDLKGDDDQELQRMIYQTYRSPEVPLLLKHDFQLFRPPAEDVEWHKKYVNVLRALARGQFRKALIFLTKIDAKFPDQEPVVYGIACVSSFLGIEEGLGEKWRRVSKLESISGLDAVEAEAIAQVFDAEPQVPDLDVVRVVYPIQDAARATELATSNQRLEVADAVEKDPFDEGPPPKQIYYFLDRDALLSPENVKYDQIPKVIGEVLIYGKQTDREARLVFVSTKDEKFSQSQSDLIEILGEVISGDPEEHPLGSVGGIQHVLGWNWHLPKGITRQQHGELTAQEIPATLERWSNMKFRVLENKNAIEAADDPTLAVPLRALLVQLFSSFESQLGKSGAFDELQKRLKIEPPARIDPTLNDAKPISSFRKQHLDFSKLTNEQLVVLQQEAMAIANLSVMRQAVSEMLGRDDFTEIPRDLTYSMMAQLSFDDTEALDYLDKARAEARKADRPIGFLLVQEFELRLARGLIDKLPSLLQTIQKHHIQEPDVEYELARILHQHGLIDENRSIKDVSPDHPASIAPVGAGLVADGSAQAVDPPVTDEPSKLWLPD